MGLDTESIKKGIILNQSRQVCVKFAEKETLDNGKVWRVYYYCVCVV